MMKAKKLLITTKCFLYIAYTAKYFPYTATTKLFPYAA